MTKSTSQNRFRTTLIAVLSVLMSLLFLCSWGTEARASGYPYKNTLNKYTYKTTGQDRDYWKSSRPYYPWHGEPLGSNQTVGPAGCGLTSVTIQLKRSGLTKMSNGDELNPGNMAHYATSKGLLNDWVIRFDEINKFVKGGEASWVTVNSAGIGGTGQPGVKNWSGTPKQLYTAVSKGISKGYYPILLLNDPGHFVAVKDVMKNGKGIDLIDPNRLSNVIKPGGSGYMQHGSYNLSAVVGIVFLKMKTKIQDAKGGTTSNDSGKKSSDDDSGNSGSSSSSNLPADNTFTVNGYGTIEQKDWDEANIDKKLPSGNGNGANPFGLDRYQIQALQDWKDGYKTSLNAVTVTYIRLGVSLMGYLLIIFSIMMVIAYSVDRLGLLDYGCVGFLTSGKFHTIYDTNTEEESYMGLSKSDSNGFGIKSLIMLVIIAVTAATLCFTGQVYWIAFNIYQFSQQIIQWGNSLH